MVGHFGCPKMTTTKSLELVDVTSCGNRVFVEVIKFRILRWEIILDHQGEP
jgi:hypothetical protein